LTRILLNETVPFVNLMKFINSNICNNITIFHFYYRINQRQIHKKDMNYEQSQSHQFH